MIVKSIKTIIAESNADQSIVVSALGVKCRESRDSNTLGKSVSGLNIVSDRANEKSTYHSSRQVYGFIKLQSGEPKHQLMITDPFGRYLPRTISVLIPDYDSNEVLENLNTNKSASQKLKIVPVKIYPSIQYPLCNGDTSIWGSVLDSNQQPCIFCRLQIKTEGEIEVITYTDTKGVYLLRLPEEKMTSLLADGEEPDAIATKKLSVYKLKKKAQLEDVPLSVFPDNFDELLIDSSDATNPYKKTTFKQIDHSKSPVEEKDSDQVTIQVGRKIRIDIHLDAA